MSVMTSKRIYRETGTCPICRNTKGMYEQIKKLQKQSDMLTLGILQEKNKVRAVKKMLSYYGEHSKNCQDLAESDWKNKRSPICTCGFEQAQKE